MTQDNWKTLRVPAEAYKQAKQQKEEHNRTWGEQLVCDNPTTTEVVETSEIVEELSNHGDNVDTITDEIETLKNEISMAADPTVDVDVDRIIKRIDDLESQLPTKVAREIQQ